MDEAVDCRDGHGLVREDLVPATEGLIGRDGKLSRLRDWIAARMTAKPDLTLTVSVLLQPDGLTHTLNDCVSFL